MIQNKFSLISNGTEDIKKSHFIDSKVFKWLKSTIDKEMYFAELTQLLHTAIIDDPKPYRKEVKELLNNLLNWIISLDIDEFIIDKPNHSVRIKPNKEYL